MQFLCLYLNNTKLKTDEKLPPRSLILLTVKGFSGFSKVKQGFGLCVVDLHLHGVVCVMEAIDEDAGEVPFQAEIFLQLSVKLSSPEISCYRRFGSLADTSGVASKVPVGGLQHGVVPEL